MYWRKDNERFKSRTGQGFNMMMQLINWNETVYYWFYMTIVRKNEPFLNEVQLQLHEVLLCLVASWLRDFIMKY